MTGHELQPSAAEIIHEVVDVVEQALEAAKDPEDIVEEINENLHEIGYQIVPINDDDIEEPTGRIAGLTRSEILGASRMSPERRRAVLERIRNSLPGVTPPSA